MAIRLPCTVNDREPPKVPLYDCIGIHHLRFQEFHDKLCAAFQTDAVQELGLEDFEAFSNFYHKFHKSKLLLEAVKSKQELYYEGAVIGSFGHYTAFQLVNICKFRMELGNGESIGETEHRMLSAIEHDCIDAELLPVQHPGSSIVESTLFP